MPTDVVMPQMGESITEGTLTKWLKQPGDTVARDEPLFEISTDKVDAEIPSPVAGVLKEIKAKEGDTVAVNSVVAVMDGEGGGSAAAAPQSASPKTEELTANPGAPAAATPAPAAPAAAAQAPTAASSTDVLMPQMGESITEGTITKWLKKVGDTVARDEPIFEISTDKVDAEIPSPAAGVLTEIKSAEGTTVAINTVVAVIGGSGAGSAAVPASSAPSSQADGNSTPVTSGAGSGAATEVTMPQMGESITEGTITKWLKKVGDTVARDEPIFEISTDKVDAEIPSPAAGVLTEIRAKEGDVVAVNAIVAMIGGGAGASSSQPAAAPQSASPKTQELTANPGAPSTVQPAQSASSGEQPRSSPLVRKIAKDNGIDLGATGINGSGSAGRVTKNDIMGYIAGGSKPAATAPQAVTPAVAVQAAKDTAVTPAPVKPAAPAPAMTDDLVPMTKMRAIIAKRMVESKQISPHVHSTSRVDMTRIVKLREKEKNKYEQRNGVKLTYMPFITRAAVYALRQHPVLNAAVQGDAIKYNKSINIGIAVSLDWGLIVPVIKNCEEKNFLGVTRGIVDVAERARAKKLGPDEVSGGTFTLTNAGIFGGLIGTPIINQPQVGILSIGALVKEPTVIADRDGNDVIAIRSVQYFTLGFDHRIVDGSDAGKFMADFKTYLENWTEDIG